MAITRPCVQCGQPLDFPGPPGDTTCPDCGVDQYVTAAGATGRRPGPDTLGRYGRG